MMLKIRPALESDFEAITGFDPIAQEYPRRQSFIHNAIGARECFVAAREEEVVAYAILDYSFYTNAFIPLVWVHETFRQQGLGTALIQHLEGQSQTRKLFTSTNVSNLPMQALLRKLGFTASGLIHNLDPGDPELVFFRYLHGDAG